MKLFPIIPIPIILIISIALILLILSNGKNILQIIMVFLLFIINLRIMIPKDNIETQNTNLDILFVIDNTISMNAEDGKGNKKRLDEVKTNCKKIIEEFPAARISIITFNNKAKQLIPYTIDTDIVEDVIEIIEPISESYAKGSSLNTPITTIYEVLENSYNKRPDNKRIIFFLSDGEITDNSTLNSYENIKEYVDNGAVIGYGTEKGGKMRYADSDGNLRYIMDYSTHNYQEAISKIDEKNLKQIAKDLEINYIHQTDTSLINKKIKEIKKITKTKNNSNDKSDYDDIYYLFVIPLLCILVYDFRKRWR